MVKTEWLIANWNFIIFWTLNSFQGHKAELQMQDTSGQGQGHSQEDEEEAKLKQDSAWMW